MCEDSAVDEDWKQTCCFNVRVWTSLYAENEKNVCAAWQLSMCGSRGDFILYTFTCWELFLEQSCCLYIMTSVYSWS